MSKGQTGRLTDQHVSSGLGNLAVAKICNQI